MAVKYYPTSRIKPNQYTRGDLFALNGKPYTGAYYLTYKGEAYTGTDPIIGGNELLVPLSSVSNQKAITGNTYSKADANSRQLPAAFKEATTTTNAASGLTKTVTDRRTQTTGTDTPSTEPTTAGSIVEAAKYGKGGNLKQLQPYYPLVLPSDYDRGYFMRYFAKRIADKGYIMEISYEDYTLVKSNTDKTYADYEVMDMMWQLTGPLKDTRVSQYQVKGGIETTNERITKTKAKTFIGLVEFIGGEYTKYAKVTG